MKQFIFYILVVLGMVAVLRLETLQLEQTQRDVASIYLDLHPIK